MKNGRYESNGTVEYFKDDKLHRDNDLPAVINADGYKFWFEQGIINRLHGPAVEGPEGDKAYYVNGKLHNDFGPALIDKFGRKEWHLDGQKLTEEKFNQHQEQKFARAEQLCTKYDIACYQVGDTCFASKHPQEEQDKFFISTGRVALEGNKNIVGKLYDTERDAIIASYKGFNLENKEKLTENKSKKMQLSM